MLKLDEDCLEHFSTLADALAGLSFPQSKRKLLAGRVQRHLRAIGVEDVRGYLRVLLTEGALEGDERAQFIAALTTNTTGFFRECHHFSYLMNHLAQHRTRAPRRRPYRIWSAGCATGAEPLSIAACCATALGRSWPDYVSIDATDIDVNVLETARLRKSDPIELFDGLDTFLGSRVDRDGYDIDTLSSAIRYSLRNILDGPPQEQQYDIIFCRNVLIYLDPLRQAHVHRIMESALDPSGMVMLGSSERIPASNRAFKSAGTSCYRKRNRIGD